MIPSRLTAEQIEVLPIEVRHLAALRRLPFHHKDLFDRLIIAQAAAEGLPVLTHDAAFARYDVEVRWEEAP